MTNNDITKQEFIERWENHTQELVRLKSNLPRDKWNEINDLTEKIKELVEDASKNLDKNLKEMEQ